jgi:hypothetical protein
MKKRITTKQIAGRCFENLAQLQYLGTTITNESLIKEEIKWKFRKTSDTPP